MSFQDIDEHGDDDNFVSDAYCVLYSIERGGFNCERCDDSCQIYETCPYAIKNDLTQT